MPLFFERKVSMIENLLGWLLLFTCSLIALCLLIVLYAMGAIGLKQMADNRGFARCSFWAFVPLLNLILVYRMTRHKMVRYVNRFHLPSFGQKMMEYAPVIYLICLLILGMLRGIVGIFAAIPLIGLVFSVVVFLLAVLSFGVGFVFTVYSVMLLYNFVRMYTKHNAVILTIVSILGGFGLVCFYYRRLPPVESVPFGES